VRAICAAFPIAPEATVSAIAAAMTANNRRVQFMQVLSSDSPDAPHKLWMTYRSASSACTSFNQFAQKHRQQDELRSKCRGVECISFATQRIAFTIMCPEEQD
jgi:hypothetical protein